MFLDTLNELMEKNHITKSSLAKQSGIPYTTIDGWYKKGCDDIRLSTLKKLSSFFDVSLDYLMGDAPPLNTKTPAAEPQGLSKEESELIKFYRQCPPEDQSALLRIAGYISQATSPEHERSYEERVMAARSSIERLAAEDEQARSQLKSQEVVG